MIVALRIAFFTLVIGLLFADSNDRFLLNKSDFFEDKALFVSLGPNCSIGDFLRDSRLRKAAYPFDWITSYDLEGVIQLLDEDFLHFLDDDFLVPFDSYSKLVNLHYHLEFIHDGDFVELIKAKYTRRIERFRNLNQCGRTVYFIRRAFVDPFLSMDRLFRYEESRQIPEEDAVRLYKSLKAYFPKLDLRLVILNDHPETDFEIEKILFDEIYFFRANLKGSSFQEVMQRNFPQIPYCEY